MKILMLSQLYPPIIGGVERHVQALSHELSKREHEVVVCTILSPGLNEYEEVDGVKIYRLEGFFQKMPFIYKDRTKKWHPPVQDRVLTTKLVRIIDKEKPDVIHAHGRIVFSVLPLRKRYNIPIILSLHTYEFICPKTNFVCDKKICDRPFTRYCIICSRAFYGLAKSIATYYSMKMSKGRLEHIDKFIECFNEINGYYFYKYNIDKITCKDSRKDRNSKLNKSN
jgi:glycosyltransferase involved in cell wall biosynthesis